MTPRMVSSTPESRTRMPRRPAAATAAVSASGVAIPRGTGAGDDQHRDGAGQSGIGKGRHRDEQDGRNEYAGRAIHRSLDRRSVGAGFADRLDDPGERAAVSDVGRANVESVPRVDAAADHRIAGGFGSGSDSPVSTDSSA